jgi:hypothetical protein
MVAIIDAVADFALEPTPQCFCTARNRFLCHGDCAPAPPGETCCLALGVASYSRCYTDAPGVMQDYGVDPRTGAPYCYRFDALSRIMNRPLLTLFARPLLQLRRQRPLLPWRLLWWLPRPAAAATAAATAAAATTTTNADELLSRARHCQRAGLRGHLQRDVRQLLPEYRWARVLLPPVGGLRVLWRVRGRPRGDVLQ